MKIINAAEKTVYVDFTNRIIYRRKSILSRLINKYHLIELGLGCFSILDIYLFILILFTFCQK